MIVLIPQLPPHNKGNNYRDIRQILKAYSGWSIQYTRNDVVRHP